MNPKLKRALNKIKDEELREKVQSIIEDVSVKIGDRIYRGVGIEESPASISHHHNYPGGLMEHTLSTVEIALALCKCIERIYHGRVNRDLVISGVILHDLYKTLTYSEGEEKYHMSPLGERLDHLSLLVSKMIQEGFPLDLIHIVSAHHGEAGPVRPRTVEALICHLADYIDSQLIGEVLKAARYLIKDFTGESIDRITAKEAFEIISSRVEGEDALLRKIEEIKDRKGEC